MTYVLTSLPQWLLAVVVLAAVIVLIITSLAGGSMQAGRSFRVTFVGVLPFLTVWLSHRRKKKQADSVGD